MKVVQIQVALFLSDTINRPDLLAEEINQKLGNRFDAMPHCVALPIDAPPEIPVVTRRSTTLPHQLNVSHKRCDLLISPLVENASLSVIETRYGEEIMDYVRAVMQHNKIDRIGVVITVFRETQEPCERISEEYFGGQNKGASELSFRVNQVTSIKGFDLNCIFSVANGISETNGETSEGILYIRDINNVVKEATGSLTPKQITSVLKHSYHFLDEARFGEAK